MKEQELEKKLWKANRHDRTMMLGLVELDDSHLRPMTGLLEEDREGGPIWFFTSSDNELVGHSGRRALAAFADKGHDLFATIHGTLTEDTDPATVERLWNPFIAAWYKGKGDPKLRLLRLDPKEAQIWVNENSLFAGLKMLLGADPKEDYKDKVATVAL